MALIPLLSCLSLQQSPIWAPNDLAHTYNNKEYFTIFVYGYYIYMHTKIIKKMKPPEFEHPNTQLIGGYERCVAF
jgi:hypothetical protein